MDTLNIQEVKEMLTSDDVLVVDIRDPESFKEAHLDNAINLTQDDVDTFIAEADKEKSLICYCYHGVSSQQAVQYFKEQGFNKVYSMEGGFEAWRQEYLT